MSTKKLQTTAQKKQNKNEIKTSDDTNFIRAANFIDKRVDNGRSAMADIEEFIGSTSNTFGSSTKTVSSTCTNTTYRRPSNKRRFGNVQRSIQQK